MKAATGGGAPQLLSNLASVSRTDGAVSITHYNVSRTFDVQANVDGTDLGYVAGKVQKIVDDMKPSMPKGTTVRIKGQVESMETSFRGLGYGLIFAIVGLVKPKWSAHRTQPDAPSARSAQRR